MMLNLFENLKNDQIDQDNNMFLFCSDQQQYKLQKSSTITQFQHTESKHPQLLGPLHLHRGAGRSPANLRAVLGFLVFVFAPYIHHPPRAGAGACLLFCPIIPIPTKVITGKVSAYSNIL